MYNKLINSIKIIKLLKNWPIFFFDYFHLIQKDIIIYHFRDGTKLITRPGTVDRGLINAIWVKKEYNQLPSFDISKSDFVVDVGAHIGIFSIFAATKAKNGRVYSYEPLLENFKFLERNILINSLKNISIFNLGVAGRKMERKFFINPVGGSLIGNSNLNFRRIQCITLEDIFNDNKLEKINFLKIDCEGAEYEILFNTPKEIFEKIDRISMEYHSDSQNLNTKLKEFLEKMGFKVIFVNTPNHILYAKNENRR
jgi:FkbM family methyltransferase